MKNLLTIKQSAELIKRGVSADKASMVCMDFNGTYAYVGGEEAQTVRDCVNGQFYVEESRVFSLSDLLLLLPKKITLEPGMNACLNIFMADDDYCVTSYTLNNNASIVAIGPCEPIDSVYRTLLWVIDHNHVKLD